MSILEFTRHKLHIACGLTVVPPSLRGCEGFPMPRALTHTMMTWALSPMVLQSPVVTPGSPLCRWCFRHSSWRGAQRPMSFGNGKFKSASHCCCQISPNIAVYMLTIMCKGSRSGQQARGTQWSQDISGAIAINARELLASCTTSIKEDALQPSNVGGLEVS